jgi:hypothetical protein
MSDTDLSGLYITDKRMKLRTPITSGVQMDNCRQCSREKIGNEPISI